MGRGLLVEGVAVVDVSVRRMIGEFMSFFPGVLVSLRR